MADISKISVNGTEYDIKDATVGNGTITIKQGGTTKGTFTTNQSGDTEINLDGGGGGSGISLSEAYPVGFVITTMTDTLPTAFTTGMTWERFAKGKTLVGVDEDDTDFATAGNTGGEKTHKLVAGEMPKHGHGMQQGGQYMYVYGVNHGVGIGGVSLASGSGYWFESYKGADTWNDNGNDQPHNNMSPYITVYFWRRVS